MTEKYFVDTNVLIYCRDLTAGKKQNQALEWMKSLWENRSGRLSTQVLNEYYYAVTQKLKPGISAELARKDVQDLFAWKPVPMDEAVIASSWQIQDNYSISFWDSLIVAAAQIADCKFLLSEDFSERQEYSGLTVINPFHQTP